jgi:hypothetical protein
MGEVVYGLIAFLLSDPDIAVAFGDRIAADRIEEEVTYPFCIIKDVTDATLYSNDGPSARDAAFQIEVYHPDKVTCAADANLIDVRLSGYRGMMGDVHVGKSFITNRRCEWAPGARHFRNMLEVNFGTEN